MDLHSQPHGIFASTTLCASILAGKHPIQLDAQTSYHISTGKRPRLIFLSFSISFLPCFDILLHYRIFTAL